MTDLIPNSLNGLISLVCDYINDVPAEYFEDVRSNIQTQIDNINLTGSIQSVSVGSVISLDYGENPYVTISGTTSNIVFNFGLVRGQRGATGATGSSGGGGSSGGNPLDDLLNGGGSGLDIGMILAAIASIAVLEAQIATLQAQIAVIQAQIVVLQAQIAGIETTISII